jgi:hypothetical protein
MNIFMKSVFLLMTGIQNLIKILHIVKQNFKFDLHYLQDKITLLISPQNDINERISEFDN